MKRRNSENTTYFAFTKIGTCKSLFFIFVPDGHLLHLQADPQSAPEEVFIMASPNIHTERNASRVTWTLLPDGQHGIAPPGGNPNIAEEVRR
jgi:hypothetical protein